MGRGGLADPRAASEARLHPFNSDDATTRSGANRRAAMFDFHPYFLTGSDRVVLQVVFLSVVIVALLMSTLFAAGHLILNLLA